MPAYNLNFDAPPWTFCLGQGVEQVDSRVGLWVLTIVSTAIVLVAALAFRERHRELANITMLAERFGLQVNQPPALAGVFPRRLSAAGRHRGREVRFLCHSAFMEKNKLPWISAAAAFNGSPELRCSIYLKAASMRLEFQPPTSKKSTLQKTTVSDPGFDEKFLVETNAPETVAAILTPKIRQEISAALEYPSPPTLLTIEQQEVRYSVSGGFGSVARAEQLAAHLDLACAIAAQIEKCRA